MTSSLTNLKSKLIEIALAAGHLILEYSEKGFSTSYKADNSTLTEADLAANNLIMSELKTAFPDVLAVSEEGAQYGGSSLTKCDWFLIDPLDGTRGFAKGSKEYTVNIALIRDSKAVAGVIFAPALGELYYGDSENGAVFYCNPREGISSNGEAIFAQAKQEKVRFLLSSQHSDKNVENFMSRFANSTQTKMSSSIKLCKIAAGEADIYPRFGPTSQWDTAAGQAILEAAGGKLVQASNYKPLIYGQVDEKGRLKINPYFIALGNFEIPEIRQWEVKS